MSLDINTLFKSALQDKKRTKDYNAKIIENNEIKTKLCNLLTKAYSDEWLAVYQYSIEGDFLNSMNYKGKLSDKAYQEINKELMLHSMEEFNHAKLLIPEIIRLGGEPITHIDSLSKNANGKFLVPEYCHNTILSQAISSEEEAIRVYNEIEDYIKDNKGIVSPKFFDTIKFILDQEHEHKDDLEKLLKEFKKDM